MPHKLNDAVILAERMLSVLGPAKILRIRLSRNDEYASRVYATRGLRAMSFEFYGNVGKAPRVNVRASTTSMSRRRPI